jgi:hypothetical protein
VAPDQASTLPRRTILSGTLLGVAGAVVGVSGCTASRPAGNEPRRAGSRPPSARGPVLLAYFSRAGENYHYGGRKRLTVGNTEVVAQMISRLIGCDVHRIEAAEPYPDDYDPTVRRNVQEQNANAHRPWRTPLTSIESYGTVLLGSPIWNIAHP